MTEAVLFEGRLGKQYLRVWLETGETIRLLTHEIGPELEQYFGKDELETFLEIDAAQLPALTAALAREQPSGGAARTAADLIAAKFDGDASATTRFRAWLDGHGIPYRFSLM